MSESSALRRNHSEGGKDRKVGDRDRKVLKNAADAAGKDRERSGGGLLGMFESLSGAHFKDQEKSNQFKAIKQIADGLKNIDKNAGDFVLGLPAVQEALSKFILESKKIRGNEVFKMSDQIVGSVIKDALAKYGQQLEGRITQENSSVDIVAKQGLKDLVPASSETQQRLQDFKETGTQFLDSGEDSDLADEAISLEQLQKDIANSWTENPLKRSAEAQNKFAWFETYGSLLESDKIKQEADALRKEWAQADGSDDYQEGSDKFKLQTGEALKQVANKHQIKKQKSEASVSVVEASDQKTEANLDMSVAAGSEISDVANAARLKKAADASIAFAKKYPVNPRVEGLSTKKELASLQNEIDDLVASRAVTRNPLTKMSLSREIAQKNAKYNELLKKTGQVKLSEATFPKHEAAGDVAMAVPMGPNSMVRTRAAGDEGVYSRTSATLENKPIVPRGVANKEVAVPLSTEEARDQALEKLRALENGDEIDQGLAVQAKQEFDLLNEVYQKEEDDKAAHLKKAKDASVAFAKKYPVKPRVEGAPSVSTETVKKEQLATIQAQIDDLIARKDATWNPLKKMSLNKEIAQRNQDYNNLLKKTEQVELAKSSLTSLSTEKAHQQKLDEYNDLMNEDTEISRNLAKAVKAEIDILATKISKDAERESAFEEGDVAMAVPTGPDSRIKTRTIDHAGAVSYTETTGQNKAFVPKGVASESGQTSLSTEAAYNQKLVEYNNLVKSGTRFGLDSAPQVLKEVNALRTELFAEKARAIVAAEQKEKDKAAHLKKAVDTSVAFAKKYPIKPRVEGETVAVKEATSAEQMSALQAQIDKMVAEKNKSWNPITKFNLGKQIANLSEQYNSLVRKAEQGSMGAEEFYHKKLMQYNALMNSGTQAGKDSAKKMLPEVNALQSALFKEKAQAMANFESRQAK